MLTNRRKQRFGSDLLGAFHRKTVAEDRPGGLGLLTAVALGEHEAVIERLVSARTARRPGDAAVAVGPVDADAVVVGYEAFVEADESLIQWRDRKSVV